MESYICNIHMPDEDEKIKSLLDFVKQISKANARYAKIRHYDTLMVSVI